MKTAWRIVKAKHAAGAFSGEGARIHGGRWNSVGTPVVYLAESRSLALLELLVHLQSRSLLKSYVRFEVEFEEAECMTLPLATLPETWRTSPPPPELQALGDAFVGALQSLALAVPSVIVPEEQTILLNPAHPSFSSLRIGPAQPVEVDPRL